jgi:hypothetical protein
MRHLSIFVLLLFPLGIWAQETTPAKPVLDIFLLRTGEALQTPHVVTYRVFEWTQTRGRWIAPDFGYYDTGYGKEQIWFGGIGAEVLSRRHIDWEQEIYVSQEAGPDSQNRRSLWIWPVVDLRLRPRLTSEIAAYPTIPLDKAQRWGTDVDRAKLEWTASSHWTTGLGYSGGICNTRAWQSRPFLTVTRKTQTRGNFEFWLQRIPGGTQVQFRYVLVRGEK